MQVHAHEVLVVVVELTADLTALVVIRMGMDEISCHKGLVQRFKDSGAVGRSDPEVLIHHISVSAVYFDEHIAMRTNMEAQFGIDRCVRSARANDTGVNHTVAVLLHVTLQRTQTERAFDIRIYGQPLFGDLGL